MFNRVATPDPRSMEPVRSITPHSLPPKPPAQPLFTSGVHQSASGLDAPTSVLGQDITISGQQLVLKTKGSLLIAGHIEGDVHGESVTVGDTGSVYGTITARMIIVQGEVKGALKGSSVNLNATSRVDGDIVKQTLSIDEGAQFDGSVRRAKDPAEVTPDLS
ncbi:MAG TPA: polymer-forming cytoskeletal protein [Hyphomicrobium sp.]|jgi:cytoskeletal protein CcmA (bactofilin family)|uniref:bactofilin family protein n=1 Tax=Hyphomicrobium sp. TaxID=82 RepID=UPI002C349D9D|nr:polymer-forming cytoskeletal protein [Hyphomicrobium sp.]HXE01744.1 polymer-forming cytoskeletal protein [Hyphomicrobium sp.]